MHTLQPIILSGGSGTRLWPLSRRLYPKQFMDFHGQTLFGQAIARTQALHGNPLPIVVCNEEQRFLAAAILQQHGLLSGQSRTAKAPILLESQGRNTAPAVTLGVLAALSAARDNDPLILALSSDHNIHPEEAFVAAITKAALGADSGKIVIFGVPPTRPESGFGYIQQGDELYPGVYAVDRFIEKPDEGKARDMLRQGGFLWNSGMFLFRASVFLEELAKYAPDVHTACREIWESRAQDLDFTRFAPDLFQQCPSISIDYAVMEHTDKACMTPLHAEWHDMGSWEAFYESAAKDVDGNALQGDVVQLDSRDCYLHSSHRLVTAVGLEGVSVIETPDAVLVLPRERSQDVKILLEELKKMERAETDVHRTVYRPWGSYETLAQGERFQVKRIMVQPAGILSLQMHHHRSEHWVVVRGTANIRVGDQERMLAEDESVYIPQGALHRLENQGRIPLEIIEIQTGSYLGEDDIRRFEDTYGRVE